MKKTLIAAGIAAVVAAPAAFAEVKISGVVEQAFTMVENGDMVDTSDNAIVFAASEDLGNGLSAFAKIVLDTDNAAAGKDQVVGLKGSFGTFMTGRMEDFTRSKLAAKMTFLGAGGAGGDGTGTAGRANAATETVEGQMNRGASRTDGGIAYVSPTMNGFHFGIAAFEDNATDIAVFYDNGPLSLAASREEQTTALNPAGTKDQVTTMLAASYTMGDLKATIVRASVDDASGVAGNDGDDMAYRLDYKMGNNTISAAYLDNESTSGADAGDITQVELVHNFSKRTAAYVSYVMDDNTGSTADVDTLTFGMQHKF
jgi:hypothetical protein